MSDSLKHGFKLPLEQQAIRDKCFHPSGTFVEFPIEDVETSIPARFEKIVRMYPPWVVTKIHDRSLTCDSLNEWADRNANELLAGCSFSQRSVDLFLSKDVHPYAAIIWVLKTAKCMKLSSVPISPREYESSLAEVQVVRNYQ
jgi:hypothetical protein